MTMAKKNWKLLHKKPVDDLIGVLLANRGITKEKDREEFLNPVSPQKIKATDIGIDKKAIRMAVGRIKGAIKNGEQIIVYGDYDADGICASAIIWEALDRLQAKAVPFIPDRFEDGYGLNIDQISKLKSKYDNLKLIITVDNGIVAYKAIKEAGKLGIDVIVTDHHTYDMKPKAHAVIHTTQTSGSGVAWFLAKELGFTDSLEIAAIGTVADQLPLTGVNRSIVKHGLLELANTKRLGLKKLLMVCGLIGKEIGTYEVGFVIAPRINASGRIAQGIEALRLLCTRSRSRAEKLAKLLDELNRERQEIVDSSLKLAEGNFPKKPGNVIVMAHEEYHEGVIGLIAGKIVEKYYRPAVVLSLKGEVAKASARSIPGFNIIGAIREIGDLIIEGGGHEMAAGFSIYTKNIEVFTERIQEEAKPFFAEINVRREIKIDCKLDVSKVDVSLYNDVRKLEPFGIGNPTPVFLSKVKISKVTNVGKTGNHKKMSIDSKKGDIAAIKFNSEDNIKKGDAGMVYRLSLNEWNGRKSVEMIVKDIKQ